MTHRACSTIVLVFALMLPCSAQVLVSPAIEKPPEQTDLAEPQRMAIYAASEPAPALRYRFWPAPENRRRQNPAPFISRAVILEMQQRNDAQSRQQSADRYKEWSEMTLDELPKPEVKRYLDRFGGSALAELSRAENLTRLEYDLQLNELSAPEMISTLLPELQETRELGRLLQLRARLAIADGRWDDAVDDLRLGFRLAEVAGHSTEFLIGRLVGFAISSMMLGVVEEAVVRPDCPNLYWALASLPDDRLFETRDAIEFESVLMSRLFADLGALPSTPIGADDARRRIRDLAEQASLTMSYGYDRGGNDFATKMLSGLYVVAMADSSRELLASTEWGEKAKNLSASEAVLRAIHLKFMQSRDGWVKWSLLPPEHWDEYRTEQMASIGKRQDADLLETMIHTLTPSVHAARHAGRRMIQQRNLLMAIESIRMHASQSGEFPTSLEKLRPVPAWSDSIALKPFGYHRLSSTQATLTRTPRWSDDPETTFQLELKVK